jgi:hypothetical protein
MRISRLRCPLFQGLSTRASMVCISLPMVYKASRRELSPQAAPEEAKNSSISKPLPLMAKQFLN